MNSLFSIFCATIIICTFIKYSSILYCRYLDYRTYKIINKKELNRYSVKPYFYKDKKNNRDSFWGFVVYDNVQNEPYTGSEKDNTNFIIYRHERDANSWCKTVRKLHGY